MHVLPWIRIVLALSHMSACNSSHHLITPLLCYRKRRELRKTVTSPACHIFNVCSIAQLIRSRLSCIGTSRHAPATTRMATTRVLLMAHAQRLVSSVAAVPHTRHLTTWMHAPCANMLTHTQQRFFSTVEALVSPRPPRPPRNH